MALSVRALDTAFKHDLEYRKGLPIGYLTFMGTAHSLMYTMIESVCGKHSYLGAHSLCRVRSNAQKEQLKAKDEKVNTVFDWRALPNLFGNAEDSSSRAEHVRFAKPKSVPTATIGTSSAAVAIALAAAITAADASAAA